MISKSHDVSRAQIVQDLFQPLALAEGRLRRADGDALVSMIETELVTAVWTLRRLPDQENRFLYCRGVLWPEFESSNQATENNIKSTVYVRKKLTIDPRDIDRMQPCLDLLRLLPDLTDRRIVFWGCWHQDGERQARIPWAKIRRSLREDLSRWTLKRRYEGGLDWLARNVALEIKNTEKRKK